MRGGKARWINPVWTVMCERGMKKQNEMHCVCLWECYGKWETDRPACYLILSAHAVFLGNTGARECVWCCLSSAPANRWNLRGCFKAWGGTLDRAGERQIALGGAGGWNKGLIVSLKLCVCVWYLVPRLQVMRYANHQTLKLWISPPSGCWLIRHAKGFRWVPTVECVCVRPDINMKPWTYRVSQTLRSHGSHSRSHSPLLKTAYYNLDITIVIGQLSLHDDKDILFPP